MSWNALSVPTPHEYKSGEPFPYVIHNSSKSNKQKAIPLIDETL